MLEFPHGHATLITALDEFLQQPQIIILRGSEADDWRDSLQQVYSPDQLCFAIPESANLPAGLALKTPLDNTVAYVCRGTQCDAPVHSLTDLAAQISGR